MVFGVRKEEVQPTEGMGWVTGTGFVHIWLAEVRKGTLTAVESGRGLDRLGE